MLIDQKKEESQTVPASATATPSIFALHLRDVLRAIFTQLGTYNLPRAAAAAMRVLRVGGRRLLRCCGAESHIDALLRIDDAARRQLYADTIQRSCPSTTPFLARKPRGRPARL